MLLAGGRVNPIHSYQGATPAAFPPNPPSGKTTAPTRPTALGFTAAFSRENRTRRFGGWCQGCRVCCIGMSLVDYNSGVTPNQKNWTQQKPLSLTKLSILKNQVDSPEACCRDIFSDFTVKQFPMKEGLVSYISKSWVYRSIGIPKSWEWAGLPMIMAQWKNGMSPKQNGASFTR